MSQVNDEHHGGDRCNAKKYCHRCNSNRTILNRWNEQHGNQYFAGAKNKDDKQNPGRQFCVIYFFLQTMADLVFDLTDAFGD